MSDGNPPAQLSVPDLPAGSSTLDWALAYAAAGWYLGPAAAGTKHPGSVLGNQWHQLSSRDPERIAAWFAGTDHGVWLHCGRSGAVVLDVDNPDALPDWLKAEVLAAPFQSTDSKRPGRGHYVFGVPAGRRFGNSVGQLGVGWGEVRGQNGVVIAAPSRHERRSEGGRYSWQHTGAVPVLPDVVAQLLPDGGADAQAAVSDAEVAGWLEQLPAGGTDDGSVVLETYLARVAAGGSRHDALTTAVRHLVLLRHDGVLVGKGDWQELVDCHRLALAEPPAGQKRSGARRGEAESLLAWCLAQPAHDLDFGPAPPLAEQRAERPAAALDGAGRGDDTGQLWAARPELAQIDSYARSRLVSPWALLGCALVRALLSLPATVVLPALVGSVQPAQLFCALFAPSGGGKSSVLAASRELLPAPHGTSRVDEIQLRSGEGLPAAFRRWNSKARAYDVVRAAALVTIDEVHSLLAIGQRTGATLLPTLRSAWSGAALGGVASDPTKVSVPPMSYRLGLVAGVQAGHAGDLVADLAGTAQRFLWMPGTDASLVRWDQAAVPPLQLELAELPGSDRLSGWRPAPVCATATEAIQQGQLDRNQGSVDALDGHALQNQERVALGLAVLAGRIEVGEEDWQLAGLVMAKSDATRAVVLEAEPKRPSAAQQAVDIRRALATDDVQSAMVQLTKRMAQHQQDKRHRADRAGEWQDGCTRSCLRKQLSSPAVRDAYDGAMAELLRLGRVRTEAGRYHLA